MVFKEIKKYFVTKYCLDLGVTLRGNHFPFQIFWHSISNLVKFCYFHFINVIFGYYYILLLDLCAGLLGVYGGSEINM